MPLSPIQYQGCFDASAQNALLSQSALPTIQATVSLTAQGFAVFNTAAVVNVLPASTPAGTYRVSVYLVVTTAFTTNTGETITIGWTDDGGTAQTAVSPAAGLTVSTTGQATLTTVFRSNGTAPITYKPAVTGSAATTGAAAFSVVVERVA